MVENFDEKYNEFSKESIEQILNDLTESESPKNRKFKMHVYFNNEEEAENWFKMFNDLCKEQIKNLDNE